jgi:hypothetical protein
VSPPDAISEFKGGVILVSHDARLIRRAIESNTYGEVWVVEGGSVTAFDGDMDDYTQRVLAEMEALEASVDGKVQPLTPYPIPHTPHPIPHPIPRPKA